MIAGNNPANSYDVGYGKPPQAGRFKPGQSGNPKGRKKGAKSLRGFMRAALAEKITVEISGKKVRIAKLEALTKRLLASALAGDLGAARLLFNMMQAIGMHEDIEDALSADHMKALSSEDLAILQRYGAAALVAEQATLPVGMFLPGIPNPIGVPTDDDED